MSRNTFQGVGHMALKTSDTPDKHEQRRSSAFGIDMDETDSEDGLLDWQQYHGLKRHQLFGIDVTHCVELLTCRCLSADSRWPGTPWQRRAALGTTAVLLALAALVLIVIGYAATAGRTARGPSQPALQLCSWNSLYLPDTIVPDVYNLRLRIPLAPPYAVLGHADIALNVSAPTHCVVLHAEGLNITSIHLKRGDLTIQGHLHTHVEAYQQVVLHFDEALGVAAGAYVLHLQFQYQLAEGVDGLYRSQFLGQDGSPQVLASTQFESIAARKALPCFDEPRFKAKFQVALETPPPPVVALSNMPVERTQGPTGGWVKHHFQATPYMSPYLLAFVVGALTNGSTSCPTLRGPVPISAWGTPARHAQLQAAPTIACAAVQQMEELTGVAWVLPKLDLVAIPEFAAGAMENWGLITYNEVDVLVDEEGDDIQQKFDVGATIAHEVSHQWFGDLVTCSGWGELWLNEGFATYFENAGAEAWAPAYAYFDFFYQSITTKALNDDSVSSSHPLSLLRPLEHLASIDNLFDSVMYEKGGSVLRMLRAYLNRDSGVPSDRRAARDTGGSPPAADAFLQGLQLYLQQRQYHTATYKDLWGSVGAAAGAPVLSWMHTWTLRKGYPLLTLSLGPKGRLTITQAPFTTRPPPTANPEGPPPDCDPKKDLGSWWIPLAWRAQASSEVQWQTFTTCETTLPPPPPGHYLLLNAGRYGFYRVNYPPEHWDLLAAAARLPPQDEAHISDDDFAGLLDDSFRLSEAGLAPISHFLSLTAALGARLQPRVWNSWAVATKQLAKVLLLLRTADGALPEAACASRLQGWLRENVTGTYIANMQLSGENRGISFSVGASEDVQVRRLRPLLLTAAAVYGDRAQLDAGALLLQQAARGAGIHPDVREAVYDVAVMSGSAEAYEAVLGMYRKATGAKEKRALMLALARAPSAPLITRSLALSLTPDIRLADMGSFLSHIGKQGGVAFNLTWEFILANTTAILRRYPGGGAGTEAAYSFGRVLKSLAALFVSDAALPRLQAWVAEHANILDPTFGSFVSENMAQNRAWLERQGEGVCRWLAAR